MPARTTPTDPAVAQAIELGELNRGIKDIIHLLNNDAQARNALVGKALNNAPQEVAVPPLIKWLVGSIATLGASALIGLGIWVVTSISTMSETLARMDERMKGSDTSVQGELGELRRRVTAVELFHQEGRK
jgi:hypothetical protein